MTLPDPDREWTIEELADRTGEPYQTVATEVRRLEKSGLITAATVGRTKLLRADRDSPYLRPLAQLASMAFGPPLVIAEEFDEIDGIDASYIYGSWAARYEGEPGSPPQDIDVLVLGRPDRDDVFDAARRAERRLGREVQRHPAHEPPVADGDGWIRRAGPGLADGRGPLLPKDGQVEQGE